MASSKIPDHQRSPDRSPRATTQEAVEGGGSGLKGAPPLVDGELLAGRFSLQCEIGRGGAGTVFSAFDTKVGQVVAVKVLHADMREASQLERLI